MEIRPVNHYKGIIWDWNGTLLNDTQLAVESMNNMLSKRGLPVLSVDRYKSIFTFPVKEYYRLAGFDFGKEPFEIPALEFIDQYNRLVWDCSLQESAIEVLNYIKKCGIPQYILSAMMQETLDQCLEYYRINHFFGHVSGLGDHYANSKLETGRQMLKKLDTQPDELLLIGDTVHDFEVASELGCPCILIAHGHQSFERLKTTGAIVLEDLAQILLHIDYQNGFIQPGC
jgi:phosphoglycolate phosphatase